MNPDSHDLIQRHMAGLLTEDETAVLQTRLVANGKEIKMPFLRIEGENAIMKSLDGRIYNFPLA